MNLQTNQVDAGALSELKRGHRCVDSSCVRPFSLVGSSPDRMPYRFCLQKHSFPGSSFVCLVIKNSWPVSRVLFLKKTLVFNKRLSFIYVMSHPMTPAFYPLAWAGNPHRIPHAPSRSNDNPAPVYMNLQLPRCTAGCVTTPLAGSYPAFSPLPAEMFA